MLTITRKMELRDLLSYVWENEIRNKTFYSDCGTVTVNFGEEGELITDRPIILQDEFLVEIDIENEFVPEVDRYRVHKKLFVLDNGGKFEELYNTSIDDFLDNSIRAIFDSNYQLIWKYKPKYVVNFGLHCSDEFDTIRELKIVMTSTVDEHIDDLFNEIKSKSFEEKCEFLDWKIEETE